MINNASDNIGSYLYICEKSNSNLEVKKAGGLYGLEGIAAVFDEENVNHRIYEEIEYLPHLIYLQEKIKAKRLVGELDHPEKFDISLKNISHIIESLEYDKANKQLKIRVRLIDGMPHGEMAKALVDAGVPLSISSRAAGVVAENKHVKIKKIFTYDLVADPGFEKAQLVRINEGAVVEEMGQMQKRSVTNGLNDVTQEFGTFSDNVRIYSISESKEFAKLLDEEEENNQGNNMSQMQKQYVTVTDLNEYSELIKTEINKLKEKTKEAPVSNDTLGLIESLTTKVNEIGKYCNYLAENLEKNIEYSNYLAENLDNNIEYSKYLAENIDNNISYTEYIAENLGNTIEYSEYLAENLDKGISFANYLAENLEKGILYTEYVAENLDNTISYSEYIAENLDKGIGYAEYLAENMEHSIAYSEYLAENLDKGISYAEYVAEKLEKNIAYSEYIAESINEAGTAVNEKKAAQPGLTVTGTVVLGTDNKKVNESVSADYTTLPGKIDTLLETVKNQKAKSMTDDSKYHFFRFLSENKKNEFLQLDETKKEKVIDALKKNAYFSEANVSRIWEQSLVEKEEERVPDFIAQMPESVRPIYEALSPNEKNAIFAQSKQFKLETPYQIKNFWTSRNLTGRKVGLVRLDESVETKPSRTGYGNNYLNSIAEELDRKFKK